MTSPDLILTILSHPLQVVVAAIAAAYGARGLAAALMQRPWQRPNTIGHDSPRPAVTRREGRAAA